MPASGGASYAREFAIIPRLYAAANTQSFAHQQGMSGRLPPLVVTVRQVAGTSFDVQAGRLIAVRNAANNPLSAASVTLNGGGLLLSTTASATFDNAVSVLQSGAITARTYSPGVASQTITLGSALRGVSIAGGQTLTLATADSYTLAVAGAISGAGALTVAGTARLDVANSYDGLTAVNSGGRLVVQNSNALGSTAAGTVVASGGQLRLQNNVAIPAAETVTITGDGPSTEGALRNESGNNSVASLLLGGAARITSNSGTLTLPNGLNLTSAVTFDGAGTTNVSGVLTGGSAITKAGTGTLALGNGGNSFSGALTVSAGTARVTADGALGTTAGGTTVASGATLELSGGVNYATLEPISIVGAGASSVGALYSTSGNNTLGANVTLTGSATIGSGTAGNKLTLAGQLALPLASTLSFTGAGDIDVQQGFGNGGLPIQYNALMGMRFSGDKAATYLDFGAAGAYTVNANGTISQASLLLSYTPALVAMQSIAMNMDRDGTATPGPGNGPFQWQAVFGSSVAGDQSSFQVAWTGEFSPDADGNFTFRSHDKGFTGTDVDDDASIFVDVNRNGVFEPGEGFQNASGSSFTATGLLAGQKYRIAIGYREGSGDEEVSYTFQGTAGAFTAETGINPGAAAQAGLFTTAVTPANAVAKSGAGTTTFLAANTYNGVTTVSAGTLVAAHDQALGTTDAGTTVASGATLGLQGGVTIAGEALTLNGTGATGRPGALANLAGDNRLTGDITAADASSGEVRIGSDAGTLTLDGNVNLRFSKLSLAGAGDVAINGAIGGVGVTAEATGIQETIYKSYSFPANGSAQDNIEGIRNTPLGANDARGVLAGNLDYANNTVVAARALSLGAASFPTNTGWTMVWVTSFTPNESGAWGFRFSNVDDDASLWIDTTGTSGVFDLTDRFYNRGCCGSSGDRFTASLNAGQTYLLGIAARDFNSGNFQNMQFKSPTAAGVTGGNWVTINATNYPTTFQTLTVANNEVVKTGTGTTTLAGNNAYNKQTTVQQGTLIAAHNNALGSTAAGTVVESGGTLGLQGGVTISGEAITLNGTGAAGRPGALANIAGSNVVAATSPITAKEVSLGEIGIGAASGTLTIDAPVDLKYSKLTVNGAGTTAINGVISGIGQPFVIPTPENAMTATQVFNRVPEASNYVLAYELQPNGSVTGANFPYTVNNKATISPFSRVAYYMELGADSASSNWVYVSMDAFTSNIDQIGIPYGSYVFRYQQIVNNMNIFAKAGNGIVTGTGLATGNIEIWPSDYGAQNDIGIPGASGSTYDFGDGGSGTGAGYGSFQVHNYGAAQVLFRNASRSCPACQDRQNPGTKRGNRAVRRSSSCRRCWPGRLRSE